MLSLRGSETKGATVAISIVLDNALLLRLPRRVAAVAAALLAMTMWVLFSSSSAYAADVYLGLQAYGSSGKPLGLGLADFGSAESARTLRAVMREDLLFSRYFTLVEGAPAPSSQGKLDGVAWGSQGAQIVLAGEVSQAGDTLSLECKLYDVGNGKILWSKQGTATK